MKTKRKIIEELSIENSILEEQTKALADKVAALEKQIRKSSEELDSLKKAASDEDVAQAIRNTLVKAAENMLTSNGWSPFSNGWMSVTDFSKLASTYMILTLGRELMTELQLDEAEQEKDAGEGKEE